MVDVARSNVSTSLKELQGWGIVRLVHVREDKRNHLESLKEVWKLAKAGDKVLKVPGLSW